MRREPSTLSHSCHVSAQTQSITCFERCSATAATAAATSARQQHGENLRPSNNATASLAPHLCPPSDPLSLHHTPSPQQANVRNYYMQFTDAHGNIVGVAPHSAALAAAGVGGPVGMAGAGGAVDPRQPDLAHLRANMERERQQRFGGGPMGGGPGMFGCGCGSVCWGVCLWLCVFVKCVCAVCLLCC